MEKVTQTAKAALHYFHSFLQWTGIGILIGCGGGLAGAAFSYAMEGVTGMRESHPWLLFLLPLAGLVIVFLYHRAGIYRSRGTNLVLLAVRTKEQIPGTVAPLIFISTVLTHLCGGSAGREGAALQLGGSIAQWIGKRLKLGEKGLHTATMCGMSACFSALFGAPVTAAVFSMEVVSVGIMHYSALVPCVAASVTAGLITKALGIAPEAFPMTGVPAAIEIGPVLQVGALAVLAAVVSILFCIVLKTAARLYEKFLPNQYLRVAAGGLLVLALTFACGSRDYCGAGTHVIARAVAGEARPEAFLLKMLFTALTLEAGFKGGEIVPTLFIGSCFGCVAGGLLGLSPSFGAGIGLMAVFCGVTNCPLTAVFLAVELLGAEGLVWYMLAAAVSYMLSGYFGLYSKQKILYAKEAPEFIDASCK
ncbi:MAG TPA: chloride channel protein [Candidatus Limivivens intestinipullorum]|uniref:Chloride channel protein n=1 Tax=Candidatus Limivivens intestinipullorum TaxID=2840858 RepID=A0A9D1JLZ2_9FIRM|nr:chloride channel protein [Candidatus Limivivens intestinipullorum]